MGEPCETPMVLAALWEIGQGLVLVYGTKYREYS